MKQETEVDYWLNDNQVSEIQILNDLFHGTEKWFTVELELIDKQIKETSTRLIDGLITNKIDEEHGFKI